MSSSLVPTMTRRLLVGRSRPLSLALAVLLVGGFTASCGEGSGNTSDDPGDEASSGGSEQPGAQPEALGDRVWVLDTANSTPTIGGDGTVTLTFESGRVSGQAPCNTLNADATVDGDQIELGAIATTRMACDPATAEAETAYLEALAQVNSVAIGGDQLTLSGNDGVELIFNVEDLAANLVGTWEITNLADGDALASPLPGTTPTIEFAADGSLAANAGCNQIVTTWELDGEALTLGDGARTLMACAEPDGVMDQEDALAAALEVAARVEVTDQLTIFNESGDQVIVATRTPED